MAKVILKGGAVGIPVMGGKTKKEFVGIRLVEGKGQEIEVSEELKKRLQASGQVDPDPAPVKVNAKKKPEVLPAPEE